MSRPRNTRDDIIPIPATHGVHIPGAIEAQEAEGAAAMQAGDCEVIPAKGYADDELTALGFVLGPIDPKDPLFRQATLPPGWKRIGTGHSMHTSIVDKLGRKRAAIFFKNAYYDRRAGLAVVSVDGYVRACLDEGTAPVLDDTWATREAVLTTLGDLKVYELERAEQWSGIAEDYAREYEAEAREKAAHCAQLADQLGVQSGGAL